MSPLLTNLTSAWNVTGKRLKQLYQCGEFACSSHCKCSAEAKVYAFQGIARFVGCSVRVNHSFPKLSAGSVRAKDSCFCLKCSLFLSF